MAEWLILLLLVPVIVVPVVMLVGFAGCQYFRFDVARPTNRGTGGTGGLRSQSSIRQRARAPALSL